MSAERAATLIAIGTAVIGAIATGSNAFDRIGRHQTVLESHEERLDKIERDNTTNERLQKLKEAVDYLGWKVGALEEELKVRRKK